METTLFQSQLDDAELAIDREIHRLGLGLPNSLTAGHFRRTVQMDLLADITCCETVAELRKRAEEALDYKTETALITRETARIMQNIRQQTAAGIRGGYAGEAAYQYITSTGEMATASTADIQNNYTAHLLKTAYAALLAAMDRDNPSLHADDGADMDAKNSSFAKRPNILHSLPYFQSR